VEFKHFPTLTQLPRSAKEGSYVAIEPAEIKCTEDLWDQLKQSLLEAAAKRMTQPAKGRRSKGPGASLGDDPAVRARILREAYDAIKADKKREPYFREVAEAVHLDTTNVWRWRRDNGWPPPQTETL